MLVFRSKLVLLLLMLPLLFSCQSNSENTVKSSAAVVADDGTTSIQGDNLESVLETMPLGSLSAEETAGLLLMREEEKLAHDVYASLYEAHGLNIFANIAESEQTHTAAVKLLLDRYSLGDPVTDDSVGVFSDTMLQGLYDTLSAQGQSSVLDALYVGAAVEELDIYDLSRLEGQIEDNEDIEYVYSNLKRGSCNHLRAFYRTITSYGGSYTPEFISQSDFDAIVNSDMERD